MLNIALTGTCTDTSLPMLARDALLTGDGGGVRYLFDLANKFSYPGGAPAHNVRVVDLAERSPDGRVVAGSAVASAGNGFDFTGITAASYVEAHPAPSASIWGGGTSPQYFLAAGYFRLPTAADWFTGGGTGLAAFLASSVGVRGYLDESDLLTIGAVATNKAITARRQTNGSSATDVLTITPGAADYGQVAQIAYWRNAAGQGFRLKTANTVGGALIATQALGAPNTGDFSAKKLQMGQPASFFQPQASAHNLRLYRGWLENLLISGRDPVTVLDADWARTMARGVFS
ncbi:hypothetical protein ASF56_04540 [Methylobacterium sp. Leaf122]|nr:hypothetical protein [Methylobacterium sp. Leaf122]KQQ12438.1 hypothetical protein ASF56_04540 [Methylobacterium sp. Leaf122]